MRLIDKLTFGLTGGRPMWQREIGHSGATVLHALQLLVFMLVLISVTVGAVLIQWTPGQPHLEVGDIAGRTFKAPEDTTYISQIRTDDARRAAYDDVDNIVKTYDPDVHEEELQDLDSFLSDVSEIRSTKLSESEKVTRITDKVQDLTEDEAKTILNLSASAWDDVQDETRRLVDRTMSQELQSDDVGSAIDRMSLMISPSLPADEREAVLAIASQFISPNVFIDDEATQQKREEARAAVEPVTVSVKEGQAIVRDGTEITAKDIEALESLGLLESRVDWTPRIGMAGLMVVLSIALTSYVFLFNEEVWRNRQLVLVGIVVLLPVLAARLLLPHVEIQYMFPAAATGMLLAILINIQFASIVSTILAMYIGVVAGMSGELTLLYFVAAIAGAFVIWRAERTMTFIWAGIASSAAMYAVALSLLAVDENLSIVEALETALETALAGALAASVTFLLFSVLGSLFGITTSLQLQELAHPRQPLLNRLAHEAPGTYHHSIIVSNLAESAISRVGGDPLLARVAVLYHDIGKLEHPTFFVENQANLGNIHDGLDPHVSAQIIIDHVRNGIALARKARVPKAIIDVIAQHHGTTRVEYFYRKAAEKDPDVDPADFTYPGPKPQNREAAVVMLADAVEASVRSMSQSGSLFDDAEQQSREQESSRLREVVHSIIQSRVDSGQLAECDLTFRDLTTIEGAFIQILEGIYHPRVEYPPAVQQAGQQAETPQDLTQRPSTQIQTD